MSIIATSILMVRPAAFGYNAETAVNNSFQTKIENLNTAKVLQEFDDFVQQLRAAGVDVWVIKDTAHPPKPDAVFPNNWFCTLPGGRLFLFPLFAPNRRLERNGEIISQIKEKLHLTAAEDWSQTETENIFLEGTGSMVIDHSAKIIYACLSPRTDENLLQKFAAANGYQSIYFIANDELGNAIYHTNVMMHIGDGYSVVCTHAITNETERKTVIEKLKFSGNIVIDISYAQMNAFAGNMLQVQSTAGQKITVLSRQAYDSLTPLQIETLMAHTLLLPVDITTIETTGGGSARCMMAELFS